MTSDISSVEEIVISSPAVIDGLVIKQVWKKVH